MFLFLKLVIDSGILPALVNLLGHPEVNVVVRTYHKKINSHFKFISYLLMVISNISVGILLER